MQTWDEKLELNGDSNVCTLAILSGFGEEIVGAWEEEYYDEAIPDLESLKAHLRLCVESFDENWGDGSGSWSDKRICRMAFVQAVTVHTQPSAEKFLEELGFKRFGPQEKLKHPSTKLSIWVMPCQDFLKAIDWTGDYE